MHRRNFFKREGCEACLEEMTKKLYLPQWNWIAFFASTSGQEHECPSNRQPAAAHVLDAAKLSWLTLESAPARCGSRSTTGQTLRQHGDRH